MIHRSNWLIATKKTGAGSSRKIQPIYFGGTGMKIKTRHYVKATVVAIFLSALILSLGCSNDQKSDTAQPEAKVSDNQTANNTDAQADSTGSVDKKADDGKMDAKLSEDLGDSYYVVMEMTSAGKTMRIENMVWGEDKMRVAMHSKDGNDWDMMATMIFDGDDMYTLEPKTKMAIKSSTGGKSMRDMIPADMMANFKFKDVENKFGKGHLKKVGKEEVRGIKATRYEAAQGPNKATIWVDENGFMRRMEAHGQDGKEIMAMDLIKAEPREWTEDDFKPGKKYKVQELNINIPGLDPSKMPKIPGVNQ
jgi:outer membrane lipoprotein-sorting protein